MAASHHDSPHGRASARTSRSLRSSTSFEGSWACSCSSSRTTPLLSHAARRISGSVSGATIWKPPRLSEILVKRSKNSMRASRYCRGQRLVEAERVAPVDRVRRPRRHGGPHAARLAARRRGASFSMRSAADRVVARRSAGRQRAASTLDTLMRLLAM
jgi:hypothetical protein